MDPKLYLLATSWISHIWEISSQLAPRGLGKQSRKDGLRFIYVCIACISASTENELENLGMTAYGFHQGEKRKKGEKKKKFQVISF